MTQTTPFTAAEITDIRRFCGYPSLGAAGYFYPVEIGGTLQASLAQLSDAEQAVVRTKYLAVLPGLETAIETAGANMGTDVAAVWTRNRTEAADRRALYNAKRRDLCGFIGVPPGPALAGGGISGGVLRA